jgi:hypothetical protein
VHVKHGAIGVVRLQSASLGALHILADSLYATGIHGVMGKGVVFE